MDIKTIKLDNSKFSKPLIDLKYGKTKIESNINPQEYNDLVECKNKIDDLNDHKTWDKSKKLSNDYELIYLPNKKIKNKSIARYEPLSRSYFKLWEIIHDFDLLNKEKFNKEIKMCGIAEGPGGFIEAFINYRKKNFTKDDKIYGITLKSTNKDIPGWKKTKYFLSNNPQISICYGEDDTGDIYNLYNILHFVKEVGEGDSDFITADGGFDFSIDFNKQELLAYKMIYCEIVTALSVQKKGGSFVCKIFDIYTNITIQFIYLLGYLYEEIYITKPYTSRPANSEKYIVCKNFKGIDNEYLKNLQVIVKKWNIIDDIEYHINSIFNISEKDIIKQVFKYNKYNSDLQIENINKTLHIIKNKGNSILFNEIVNRQKTKALEWCNKYNIEINT